MFRNDFQGGPYFEIFSAQGKDSTSHWKLQNGPGIKKLYEKEVKGYVYTLEGTSATTRIQLPRDSRHSLTLIQRYLVLQLYLVKGQEFSIELGVTDMHNNKRRIQMSTSQKETQVTPLHARIPLNVVRKAVWLNLCLDLVSLVGETWKGETYRAIEAVAISANCKLKRVFTMKVQPPDTTDDDELYGCSNSNPGEVDPIPKHCQLPTDVMQCTQVLTLNKIKHGERLREGSGTLSRPVSILNLDSSLNSQRSYHIAFGSKVPTEADTSRKSARQGNFTNRSMRSTSSRLDDGYGTGSYLDLSGSSTSRNGLPSTRDPQRDSSAGSNTSQPRGNKAKSEPALVDENDNQNFNQKGVKESPIVTPHPPREPSSDRRRRRPRVKNVDTKERQSSAGSVKEDPTSLGSDSMSHGGDSNYQTVTSTSDLYTHSGDRDASDFSSGEAATVWNSISKREVIGQSVSHSGAVDKSDHRRREFPSLQGSRMVKRNPLRSSQDRGVGPDVPEIQTPRGSSAVDADESISEVIGLLQSDVLRGQQAEDDDSIDSGSHGSEAKSYESSEEDSSDHNHLHVFSVAPTTAPHRNMSPNTAELDAKQAKKARPQRSNPRSTLDSLSSRGARLEDDFVNDMSSTDEETTPSRHRKPGSRPHSGSSRPHSGTSSTSSPKTRDQRGGSGGKHRDSGGRTRTVDATPKVSSISPEQRGQFNPALYADQNGGLHANVISRMSLKNLVQIPSNDARISNANPSSRQYDFTKYQMADVTDSFEAQMFLSMKRQQEEEEAPDSPRKDPNTFNRSPRRSHHDHLAPQMYSESPTTTSDDDTSFSTWKAPIHQMPHNYQDEMKSRLSSDTLTSSNPRDWSGVYSPPIVLPGDLNHTGHMVEEIPESHNIDSCGPQSTGEDTDDDKVNLLFDPSLNCYYDPVTRKYYELKGTPGIG
ncbi:protein CFAP20DC-like [Haliotis rufescens]|uniref:protein CFAP20DC-like n=1 Tax=Haliotis rufescens TaxID=6454 RepID=UPI00201F6E62|nr:protein CFAP20DC-like [Haliotis rufescens]